MRKCLVCSVLLCLCDLFFINQCDDFGHVHHSSYTDNLTIVWLLFAVCYSWGHGWNQAIPLRWRHNERDGVSNHQPHHCLLNCWFRRRSKKTSNLRVTGLCEGNSPVTGEFSAQKAGNAENVSIWWRHHGYPTKNNKAYTVWIILGM